LHPSPGPRHSEARRYPSLGRQRASRGFSSRPPYFTTVTETACDLMNAVLRGCGNPPPHNLESLAATPPFDTTPPTGEWAPRLARTGSTMPRSLRSLMGTCMSTILSWSRRRSTRDAGSFAPLCTRSTKCSVLCWWPMDPVVKSPSLCVLVDSENNSGMGPGHGGRYSKPPSAPSRSLVYVA
jgi:hypothetical protein